MREERNAPCDCQQRFTDLARSKPINKKSLIKVVCENCGKTFFSNTDKRRCFDCEAKMSS